MIINNESLESIVNGTVSRFQNITSVYLNQYRDGIVDLFNDVANDLNNSIFDTEEEAIRYCLKRMLLRKEIIANCIRVLNSTEEYQETEEISLSKTKQNSGTEKKTFSGSKTLEETQTLDDEKTSTITQENDAKTTADSSETKIDLGVEEKTPVNNNYESFSNPSFKRKNDINGTNTNTITEESDSSVTTSDVFGRDVEKNSTETNTNTDNVETENTESNTGSESKTKHIDSPEITAKYVELLNENLFYVTMFDVFSPLFEFYSYIY